jgi:hypothetical protein
VAGGSEYRAAGQARKPQVHHRPGTYFGGQPVWYRIVWLAFRFLHDAQDPRPIRYIRRGPFTAFAFASIDYSKSNYTILLFRPPSPVHYPSSLHLVRLAPSRRR